MASSILISCKIKRSWKPKIRHKESNYLRRLFIYIAIKRRVQVGDKISGRHGNKGIVSRILPRQDMPYLPDGTPLDLVLNPLGVPSRMNVGQIFETLLGLAGSYLHQTYRICPFDEIYGCEASRSLVYSKLYEARLRTNQSWLFDPNFPGKVRLFDGRTGQCFQMPVTVGQSYIFKLIHMVDEKIHARNIGPYSLITQQPLRGRSKQGGQRFGEMEVWAIEGFGAPYILQELFTIKSDDLIGRKKLLQDIVKNRTFTFSVPEAFRVLMLELRALCTDFRMFRTNQDKTMALFQNPLSKEYVYNQRHKIFPTKFGNSKK
jgi:DNA-directed RNA polymerase subunit beta